MQNNPAPVSKTARWIGWILTVLPCLLLIMSAVMKFTKPPAVVEGFAHFGIAPGLINGLGVLELACAIIYLIPRTAVLGAILVTGYLGGAIMTNLRVGQPYIAIVAMGIAIWGGLYLRDVRVRNLIPLT